MGAIEIGEAKERLVGRLTAAAHAAAKQLGTPAVAVLQMDGMEAGWKLLQLLGRTKPDFKTEIENLCTAVHEFEAIIALVETQPSSRVNGPVANFRESAHYDQTCAELCLAGLRGWPRILADSLREGGLCVTLEAIEEDGSPDALMVVRS